MTPLDVPHICPWWVGHLLASPVRCLVHDAAPVVAPFVTAGMTVLEPGCGMGHFTLELARRVGPGGRVVAADVEPRMLVEAGRRLRQRRLLDRVELRQAEPARLGVEDLAGRVGFALAFAVAHEVADRNAFFHELASTLTAEGRVLLAEPKLHVSELEFDATVAEATRAGLVVRGQPRITWCHAVTLSRAA